MNNPESNIYVPGWDGQVPLLTGEDFEAAATGAFNIGKAYLPGTNEDGNIIPLAESKIPDMQPFLFTPGKILECLQTKILDPQNFYQN